MKAETLIGAVLILFAISMFTLAIALNSSMIISDNNKIDDRIDNLEESFVTNTTVVINLFERQLCDSNTEENQTILKTSPYILSIIPHDVLVCNPDQNANYVLVFEKLDSGIIFEKNYKFRQASNNFFLDLEDYKDMDATFELGLYKKAPNGLGLISTELMKVTMTYVT